MSTMQTISNPQAGESMKKIFGNVYWNTFRENYGSMAVTVSNDWLTVKSEYEKIYWRLFREISSQITDIR
jgi:hypothetical protein